MLLLGFVLEGCWSVVFERQMGRLEAGVGRKGVGGRRGLLRRLFLLETLRCCLLLLLLKLLLLLLLLL